MKIRELCKINRTRLIELIENTALDEYIPFTAARKQVTSRSSNFEMVWGCQQGWYRGKIPSAAVVRKWRNKDKLALAHKWPDLTPEEHELAAPYLPVHKRPEHLQRKNLRADTHSLMRTMHKHGRSYSEIAAMLGVHEGTVRRVLKDPNKTRRYTTWTDDLETKARALLAEGKSRTEIADLINVSPVTLYRRIPVK